MVDILRNCCLIFLGLIAIGCNGRQIEQTDSTAIFESPKNTSFSPSTEMQRYKENNQAVSNIQTSTRNLNNNVITTVEMTLPGDVQKMSRIEVRLRGEIFPPKDCRSGKLIYTFYNKESKPFSSNKTVSFEISDESSPNPWWYHRDAAYRVCTIGEKEKILASAVRYGTEHFPDAHFYTNHENRYIYVSLFHIDPNAAQMTFLLTWENDKILKIPLAKSIFEAVVDRTQGYFESPMLAITIPQSSVPLTAKEKLELRICDATKHCVTKMIKNNNEGEIYFWDEAKTPWGYMYHSDLERGDQLISFDVESQQPIISRVKSSSFRSNQFDEGVEITLQNHQRSVIPLQRGVYKVNESKFVPASTLVVGDQVLTQNLISQKITSIAPWIYKGNHVYEYEDILNISYPDNFFSRDGILISDTGQSPSSKPERSTSFQPSTAQQLSITALPGGECAINFLVDIDRDLPAGPIAIVTSPSKTRYPKDLLLACNDGHETGVIPGALWKTIRQSIKAPLKASLFLEYNHGDIKNKIHCDKPYLLRACHQNSRGEFTETAPSPAAFLRSGRYCFGKGTPILTTDGVIPIEQIKTTHKVLSLNIKSKIKVISDVKKLIPRGIQKVASFTLENGTTFQVTGEHPIFVVEKNRFVKASSIKIGNHLLTSQQQPIKILFISPFDRFEEVFDLSVASPNNYFAADILSHNY